MIPNGWKDDPAKGILTAPNGPLVIKGFRDWILNNTWEADNYPLENEHGCDQLEMSNPSLGPGTKQRFRKTTLEWTASRGVFVAWTGPELIELERLLSAAEHSTAINPALLQELETAVRSVDNAVDDLKTTITRNS